MSFNPLNPQFWALGFWQGIGVLVSVLSLFLSPLLSMGYERLFGKKEHQEEINAYKAIILPDDSLGPGEFFFFLPVQAATSYFLFILLQRVFMLTQYQPNTLFALSCAAVFLLTWGLCAVRRKSFAKLLTWHLCLTTLLFCLLLIGWAWHKGGNAYLTRDFSFVKHYVGQLLSPDVKQFPLIAGLRNISLSTIPVDLKIASPLSARSLLIEIYCFTLAILLFFYALHKRHRANRLTAFVHLSEKRRREELDKLDYQDKIANLELKGLTKQEKEGELDLKKEQHSLILARERLALEKERLGVESLRLDVEKKRAEYTLELAVRLIDTLYGGVGNPDVRAETLRHTLPAFKDFGHPDGNSTTVVLQVLQETSSEPKAIPVSVA